MLLSPERTRRIAVASILLAAALIYKGSEGLLDRYRIGFNATESLSNWGYIIDRKNRSASIGDLIEFIPPANEYYPAGASFVKRIAGVPGEEVERRGDVIFVGGREIGRVKSTDRNGKKAVPGPLGVIPEGSVFVAGDHPDSLDSRYAVIGFVETRQIIGVGEPIL